MSGSNTTDPGNRSSAEIEREVEATRANLTGTLEELRDRASPGQLFEQALDYARSSGGADMARNLGQAVRDNPLPLLLIGAGIGWLMLSGNNRSGTTSHTNLPALPASDSQLRVHAGTTSVSGAEMDHRSSFAGRATEATGDMAGRVRDSVTGAASQVSEMGGAAYDKAGSALGAAAESVRSAAASAADRLSATGGAARDHAGQLSDSTRQGVGWLMREQPLVLGAIGVALGAAIGALLPGTATEDRLMGEARDAVAERGEAVAREGYERVKEVASRHVESAKDVVGDATGRATDQLGSGGGVAAELGHAVTDAARQLRETARDAAHDIASEAHRTMGTDEQGKQNEPRREGGPRPV